MNTEPYRQYARTHIETASPERLLLMLYDGAIKFAGLGREALKKHDRETAHTHLLKAQEVVAELAASLDTGSGKLATNLLLLYDFVDQCLVEANVQQRPEAAERAVTLLRQLREAWNDAFRAGDRPGAARTQPPVHAVEAVR